MTTKDDALFFGKPGEWTTVSFHNAGKMLTVPIRVDTSPKDIDERESLDAMTEALNQWRVRLLSVLAQKPRNIVTQTCTCRWDLRNDEPDGIMRTFIPKLMKRVPSAGCK